jgi:hypothetical protein
MMEKELYVAIKELITPDAPRQLQQEALEMSTPNMKYCSINDIIVTFEI